MRSNTFNKCTGPATGCLPLFYLAVAVSLCWFSLAPVAAEAASLSEMSSTSGKGSITVWPPKTAVQPSVAAPDQSSVQPTSQTEGSQLVQTAAQNGAQPVVQATAQNTAQASVQGSSPDMASNNAVAGVQRDPASSPDTAGQEALDGQAARPAGERGKSIIKDPPHADTSAVPVITPGTALRNRALRNSTVPATDMGQQNASVVSWSANATKAMLGYDGTEQHTMDKNGTEGAPQLKPIE